MRTLLLSTAAFAMAATGTPGGANLLAANSGARFGLVVARSLRTDAKWRAANLASGAALAASVLPMWHR